MKGNIVRVKRKRVGILDEMSHKNEHTTVIDQFIARTKSYYHYGIQVSSTEIVHFVGPSYLKRKNSKVELIDVESFLRGEPIEVVKDYERLFPRKVVIERALSMLGSDFGTYSVFDNNCEHFATWCYNGIRQSTQGALIRKSRNVAKVPLKPLSILEKKLEVGHIRRKIHNKGIQLLRERVR